MNKNPKTSNQGFTLIEILVVIGIIAILAAVVLIAINPARQFKQAHDSQRVSNISTILDAVGQRIADNKGVFNGTFSAGGTSYTCPTLTAGTVYTIGSGATGFVSPATAMIDLSCLVPTYIAAQLPIDPSGAGALWTSTTSYNTDYNITVDSNGRYTVSAPDAEISSSTITR